MLEIHVASLGVVLRNKVLVNLLPVRGLNGRPINVVRDIHTQIIESINQSSTNLVRGNLVLEVVTLRIQDLKEGNHIGRSTLLDEGLENVVDAIHLTRITTSIQKCLYEAIKTLLWVESSVQESVDNSRIGVSFVDLLLVLGVVLTIVLCAQRLSESCKVGSPGSERVVHLKVSKQKSMLLIRFLRKINFYQKSSWGTQKPPTGFCFV